MSKERARRREERLAVAEARRLAEERAAERRARRLRLRHRLTIRRGRVGKVGRRRSRAQLATIVLVVAVAEAVVWYLIPDWPIRIAAAVLAVVAVPALVTLSFDRSVR